MGALGIGQGKRPKYTATLFLELHRKPDIGLVVEVYYKPTTDNDTVIPMELPGKYQILKILWGYNA